MQWDDFPCAHWDETEFSRYVQSSPGNYIWSQDIPITKQENRHTSIKDYTYETNYICGNSCRWGHGLRIVKDNLFKYSFWFLNHIHVINFQGVSGRFSFHFREFYEKCIEYIRKFFIQMEQGHFGPESFRPGSFWPNLVGCFGLIFSKSPW